MKQLRRFWTWWKRVAHRIGEVQSRILLSVIYATLILPYGIVFTFLDTSFGRSVRPRSNWHKRTREKQSLAPLYRQF